MRKLDLNKNRKFTHYHFCKTKNWAGFTTVELIVVLAIFVFIMIAASSIFISATQRQKSILVEQEFSNQVSYAMELLSRKTRMAIKDGTGNCLGIDFINSYYVITHLDGNSGFYQGIKFLGEDNICYEFFLDSNNNLMETKNNSLPQNILSEGIQINYFRVIINGDKNIKSVSAGSSVQPRITFVLNAKIIAQGFSQAERVFETTVSQRNFEIDKFLLIF